MDDPRRAAAVALLREHLADMALQSPPESRHALDVDGLSGPFVTFWTGWDGDELVGCGALLELDPRHGEIKSMRTARAHLRRGVATRLLRHIVDEATRRRYVRLSLETGSQEGFAPARALYRQFGFIECAPFGAYRSNPNSVFMTRAL